MKYLVIIVLLVIVGLLEFFFIRKGMKAAGRISPNLRGDSGSSPVSSLANKHVHRKERRQESFPPQQEVVEPVESRETGLNFAENSPKIVELSALKREIRQKESPLQEPSMLDIIQEIRGESAHLSQDLDESSEEQGDAEIKPASRRKDMESPQNEPMKEPAANGNTGNNEGTGDLERAREEKEFTEDVEDAEEVVPPEELIKSGLELVRRGHLDEGIKKIEAVIAYVPEKADAHFNLGIAYTLQENIPQAIIAYQQAIAIDPRYGKAFYNLGTLYLKQGNVREAITKLEHAVKLLPDSMKALWNLYEAYRSSGLFTKALASLQQLIALEPEDASLYNHLGICYVKLGDYGKAINSWKRAISLGASSHLIHYNLGKTYELYGEFVAAKDHYKQFIALAAKTSNWQELVAEVQDRLDNLEQSRL